LKGGEENGPRGSVGALEECRKKVWKVRDLLPGKGSKNGGSTQGKKVIA